MLPFYLLNLRFLEIYISKKTNKLSQNNRIIWTLSLFKELWQVKKDLKKKKYKTHVQLRYWHRKTRYLTIFPKVFPKYLYMEMHTLLLSYSGIKTVQIISINILTNISFAFLVEIVFCILSHWDYIDFRIKVFKIVNMLNV
jgi:hypothetical protein